MIIAGFLESENSVYMQHTQQLALWAALIPNDFNDTSRKYTH